MRFCDVGCACRKAPRGRARRLGTRRRILATGACRRTRETPPGCGSWTPPAWGSSTPPACVGVGHRCCWERRPAPDWPSVAADGHDTDPPPNDVRGIAARPAAARTGRSALAHAAPTGDASHATPRPRRPCSAWKTSQSTTGARRTQTAARTHTPQHQTYRTVPTITTTAQRILRSIERRPTTPVQLFRRRIVDGPRTATGSRRAQSTATDGPRTAPARPWERAGVPLSGDFGPFDRSGPPFGRCTRSGGRLGPP